MDKFKKGTFILHYEHSHTVEVVIEFFLVRLTTSTWASNPSDNLLILLAHEPLIPVNLPKKSFIPFSVLYSKLTDF